MKRLSLIIFISSTFLFVYPLPGITPDSLALRIPAMGSTLHPPGVLEVPNPENLQEFIIHIPSSRVEKAFGRLNTIATGPVQDQRRRRDELLYRVDLARHRAGRFSFQPEANIIEMEVVEEGQRGSIYARWVIAAPSDPQGWKSHETVGVSENAALAKNGIQVMAGAPLEPLLNHGLTTELGVTVVAAFSTWNASIGLRVQWEGAEGRSQTLSAGGHGNSKTRGSRPVEPAARELSVPVALDLGTNQLEVEVLHGDQALARSRFSITRQRPSLPGNVDGDRWAVVIGVSNYQKGQVRDLRYAHRDAEFFRDLLITKGEFLPDRVRLLTNEEASLENVRTALFDFLARTKPEDLVVIFVAGHGVRNPRAPDNFYFLVTDSDIENLGGTAVPLWDLGAAMGHTIRSRNIVVIADTCHSGAVIDYETFDDSGLNFINKYVENLAKSKGRLVLTASQAHEQSLEKDDLRHGAFTYHLLEALRGAADTDRNKVVTLQEALDYIKLAVPEETRGQQHPTFRSSKFDTNLSLTFTD